MALLSDLSLSTTYRSNGNGLVKDFYVPCYERSILYRRAVGYFTSSGMAVAARGIAKFISTGGRMRLIASPRLEQRDIDAIDQGYKSREQIVDSVVSRELDEIENSLIKDQIAALAWMVEVGVLDIKLALPVDDQGKIKYGL